MMVRSTVAVAAAMSVGMVVVVATAASPHRAFDDVFDEARAAPERGAGQSNRAPKERDEPRLRCRGVMAVRVMRVTVHGVILYC